MIFILTGFPIRTQNENCLATPAFAQLSARDIAGIENETLLRRITYYKYRKGSLETLRIMRSIFRGRKVSIHIYFTREYLSIPRLLSFSGRP